MPCLFLNKFFFFFLKIMLGASLVLAKRKTSSSTIVLASVWDGLKVKINQWKYVVPNALVLGKKKKKNS